MFEDNLKQILTEISKGNNLGEKVTLVGATKTVPVETVNRAIECGLEVVAENKVQEFRDKTALINGARQHFIGHLQTNKVKYIVGNVELIHSVDSIHLAEEIARFAVKHALTQDVLAEINVGGELSKSGFDTENAVDAVKEIARIDGIKVKGLMAMLPHSDDEKLLTTLCQRMRSIYDELKAMGYDMQYLSVGMSADYKIAIANGSNTIRLGSAIFGERHYN